MSYETNVFAILFLTEKIFCAISSANLSMLYVLSKYINRPVILIYLSCHVKKLRILKVLPVFYYNNICQFCFIPKKSQGLMSDATLNIVYIHLK